MQSSFQTSTAEVKLIKDFRPQRYDHKTASFYTVDDFKADRFPTIIKSNGETWQIASIYFQDLLITQNKDSETIVNRANHLKNYLRFLEENSLPFDVFPFEQEKRPTYLYFKYLHEQIDSGAYSSSYASESMRNVIKLYKFCIEQKLFGDHVKDRAYRTLLTRITQKSQFGDQHTKEVETTDLAIKVKSRTVTSDEIIDGGRLHPLTVSEQKILDKYLKKAPVELYLMCAFALHTGARLQTVCTIKKHHILDLKRNGKINSNDNTYSIKVGKTIDTKDGAIYSLRIPVPMVESLWNYVHSEEWMQRAELSFYGASDENYVFLSRYGNPFYTSRVEKILRKQDHSLDKKYSLQIGGAVRELLRKLQNEMKVNNEDIRHFSFHDFRATFGLNLLRKLLKQNCPPDQAMLYLKQRMGHKSIETTHIYMQFAGYEELSLSTNQKFENMLYGDIDLNNEEGDEIE
ncbi:site-specific integrase [Acinetobacter baumannii]|uniref:site-specific integrase n=1 Tax=Acinetobacter TaxID=469 RepID=UPI00044FBF68|nr:MULTISPECIES: site-specific integrase [Acinetobacter]EXB76398.1 phage integrase family protein [Acinetobacter sp. 1475718]EXS15568.1 phage integrase family protein [Acinetobacter sp. 883425]MDU1251425.1 site-specific integrase [Acinetobacter sp.]MDV4277962.1 site-specific integrase [Acinetobacter baumannii]